MLLLYLKSAKGIYCACHAPPFSTGYQFFAWAFETESFSHLPGKSAVYFQMSLCALKQKQYGDAESLLSRALTIREQWYGTSHPLVAEVVETLARLYSLDGQENRDPVMAEKMYRKALRMREEAFGSSDLTVADTLVDLGMRVSKLYSLLIVVTRVFSFFIF